MSRKPKVGPVQPASPRAEGANGKSIAISATVLLIALVACAAYLTLRGHASHADESPLERPQPPTDDARNVEPPPVGFQATIENHAPSPGPPPKGMVWVPGGEFSMGASDPPGRDDLGMKATWDARPIHRVYVDGFYMDRRDVTNAQFAEFVGATGYVTVAERAPRAEDFPGAPPENLFAGSVVFSPPNHAVPLNNHFQWWAYVKRANWRHPSGPQSNILGKGNYPVVQVAYEDALAYAKWAGKRLPTEAEWEFAARGGLAGKPFVWGDEFRPNGKWMANTYQGHFPDKDTGEDGFIGISPVTHYPPNSYGLYDMAGNV